ncbi:Thyroid peroxidase [Amphibalanus amphitrite]|uniref:Thyroid peroxidase n=1 Tax=Amphibalanus amphitrite TaxID=1232801 RepID=A0A6A4W0P1_AMPAM|nr:Thyroid peroxidase [Amphibalanus amphitrite]
MNRCLANANSSEADNYLVDTIRNRLFAPPGAAFGLDLGALNIQRGRDHGLPSYVQWRRACRLTPVDSFAQLKTVMSPLAVAKLITTYKDLADVDLYVGGLLETPLEGALVGPTLACLMANQFQTLRRGDRFWYENGDERHSFTPGQLRELRKVTLSKVICDNSALATIQPDIMFKPDDTSNQRVKCRHLPALDLRLWASELGCVAPQRPQTGPGGRPGPARPPPFWPGGRPAGGPTPFPGGPPPAGSVSSTPPPTRPAAGTDDSLERPVFPGSEPTEPVTPTGAGPSTAPATSDGQPPSWEPQPPSQAPAVEPPAQVVPVDPAVLPPSEPTPGPAVVPVDPAVWPPSRPTPGAAPLPEIAVDPPRTTTPRPTPGPAVIPVDPPVLPPAGPTPGPVAPVPVSPPLLPPGEPLQPAPAPLPTPGPHQPIHPPVLPPAPAPTPGPGEGIRPVPLPTPGPHQPIHPSVLPPAPGPGAQILPAPVPGPGVEVLPTPGPGAQIQPPVQPPPVPFPSRPTPTMMMSAMTLTVPAALWPTAPGKQLVIVAGRRPVVTIIPVPRPALGGPSALSSLPPAVIFPSRESGGGGGAPTSVSGTPTVPAMTIEATGSFTTLSMLNVTDRRQCL